MRYISLSVNRVPKYSYYLPLVCWAWKRYNWKVIIMHEGEINPIIKNCKSMKGVSFVEIDPIDGIASETVTQVSRLFASSFVDIADYVMTSDADMIPLSDHFNPYEHKITSYGRDLTDYHYPICYVGMPAYLWYKVMGNDYIYPQDIREHRMFYIKKGLEGRADAKSDQPELRWVTDQNMLTEKLLAYGSDFIIRKDRGTYQNGYPLGRVDRSAWTLNHGKFIDCHAPHNVLENESSYNRLIELIEHVWPNEDWGWFKKYTEDFKKLINE